MRLKVRMEFSTRVKLGHKKVEEENPHKCVSIKNLPLCLVGTTGRKRDGSLVRFQAMAESQVISSLCVCFASRELLWDRDGPG